VLPPWQVGMVIGVALDMEEKEMRFYFDGKCAGVAFSGFESNEGLFPALVLGANAQVEVNFGRDQFERAAKVGGWKEVDEESKAKKAKDAEAKAAGLNPDGQNISNGNENRSPERRNRREHQRSNSNDQREFRTPSQQRRERSHTNQGRQQHIPGGPSTPSGNMRNLSINPPQPAQPVQAPPPPELSVTSPTGGSPNAKKLRGLQKKIRAIEDLEMRLAGGEKLEDTQMKKIATKSSVQAELNGLDQEN